MGDVIWLIKRTIEIRSKSCIGVCVCIRGGVKRGWGEVISKVEFLQVY